MKLRMCDTHNIIVLCLLILQAINVTSNNTASTLASLNMAINETEPADQLQVNFVVVVQVFSNIAAMALVQDSLTVEEERQV